MMRQNRQETRLPVFAVKGRSWEKGVSKTFSETGSV